ncbi:hypothetical protein P167DRAFT_604057 [Morchella conica CCBAS932]|uniref:MutL C-terminal dimerisation domain-containing protein n=1 Tax=Morchella conica CCBAS932 TaxID=1392247 RepID=A0A3N4KYS4_9PEZI|nr:hypothetical protein P167DRAFT_604057 [Morchella conica CCBAS932]
MPPTTAPQIKPLPASATVRLRSTLAITSLSDAVSELVQNSLDAGARSVAVQVNVARNSCVVEDDGMGILPGDVGMVGRMYATSKYTPSSPTTHTFGSRGLALSSLSTHSLFTLTTRHTTSPTTHTTRISYSTPLTTGPSPPHLRLPHHGTTVRIDALHADLPVRFHARLAATNPDSEWSTITNRAAHLLLSPAATGVSFVARDENGKRRISVRGGGGSGGGGGATHWRMAVLRQIYGRDTIGPDWERVRAVQGATKIRGHISASKGAGSRELQFVAVNGHPLVGATALHAEVNRVFAASSFGAEDEGGGGTRRKGVEKWPMFVLDVECAAGADVLGGEGGTEGKGGLEGGLLGAVVALLGRLVGEFLRAHHFSPAEGKGTARERAGTPLGTITNGSARETHGDTRALALRSRVKAAKQDAREEEGRKGAGFSAFAAPSPSPIPSTGTTTPTEQTDMDTASLDIEIDIDTDSPDGNDSSKENEPGNSTKDTHIHWRNPLSRHSFRVNARTGNTSATSSAAAAVARKRALSSSCSGSAAKKPRTEEPGGGGKDKDKDKGPFIDALLKNWKNPVFAPTEAPIHITKNCTHHCGPTSSTSTTTTSPTAPTTTTTTLGKLTKPGLATATVIAQLDRKYILLKMRGLSSSTAEPELLVLLDQHAASERIRVEALFASLTTTPPQTLLTPLLYVLNERDAGLLVRYAGVLREWGVCYHVSEGQGGQGQTLHITALPSAVADRCSAEPALALAMVRRHVYALSEDKGWSAAAPSGGGGGAGGGDWVKRLAGCPGGLVEMVNSRACRGAVMFGDVLEMEECVSLVRGLAGCRFPFMCAHGRPCMVPLVDLGVGGEEVEKVEKVEMGEGGRGFKKSFGEWMKRREGEGE